jgi:hypothetical protein
MSNWLLTGVLLAWAALSALLAHHIGEFFWHRAQRHELKAVLFIALVPLPLLDEMLGKAQFDQLCREQALAKVTVSSAVGRTVRRENLPPEAVRGLLLPVVAERWRYVDIRTNEPVLNVSALRAEGGKLVRALDASADASPLTFDGECTPHDEAAMLSALAVQVVGTATGAARGQDTAKR